MNWTDEGIVLSVRPHGETAAVAELFTRTHGRHLGLVHGGRARRIRPVLQIGNHVDVTWNARLAEHLGNMKVELRKGYAAAAMDDPAALTGLTSMCALTRLLPERDPHSGLYEISLFVLSFLDDVTVWPALMVRWELALLGELGFGLDLTTCAAGGDNDDLAYVSPRSGRAVSAAAGEPYKDKLLRLPEFLREGRKQAVTSADVTDGLRLTSFFLRTRVLNTREMEMPTARTQLPERLANATLSGP